MLLALALVAKPPGLLVHPIPRSMVQSLELGSNEAEIPIGAKSESISRSLNKDGGSKKLGRAYSCLHVGEWCRRVAKNVNTRNLKHYVKLPLLAPFRARRVHESSSKQQASFQPASVVAWHVPRPPCAFERMYVCTCWSHLGAP